MAIKSLVTLAFIKTFHRFNCASNLSNSSLVELGPWCTDEIGVYGFDIRERLSSKLLAEGATSRGGCPDAAKLPPFSRFVKLASSASRVAPVSSVLAPPVPPAPKPPRLTAE